MKKHLLVTITLCSLTGCATVTSDQSVISNASAITGNEIVSIQNRRQIGLDTFYTAIAKDGTKYSCQFNGGDVLSFGVVQHPKCEKQSL